MSATGVFSSTCSALHPHFAVPVLPAKVVVGAFQNRGLEAVGRLEFKIEQRPGGGRAVLLLGRDEDHVAGPDRAHALVGLHRRLASDDEIKVLAVLVEMERRGGALLVGGKRPPPV